MVIQLELFSHLKMEKKTTKATNMNGQNISVENVNTHTVE